MYRIKKPSTNFENIPVSSMEGPSSPTSITFWQKESIQNPDIKDGFVRKKYINEKMNTSKNVLPRVKYAMNKFVPSGGTTRNSHTLVNRSRPSSPPSMRYDSSKIIDKHIMDTKKVITEYIKSGAGSPGRDRRLNDQTGSSAGANSRRVQQNIKNVSSDIADNSRDVSTANTFSDLPPDGCWTSPNPEEKKPQVLTKDCTVQTSSCLIKARSSQYDEDSFQRLSHKKINKSIKNSIASLRPKTKSQSSQGSKNRAQMTHPQSSGKRKLKIPEHKIIYMDKLDPTGAQFWAQIASELDKKESVSSGRVKRAQS